jgi:uncharacterized protein YndB with AHSA1/START domain
MKNTDQNNEAKLFLKQEFDAPKELVFNAFADAEALAQWWGPPGVPIGVVKFEFKPKGIFHYKAEMQGQVMWGRFIYSQIEAPDLIEFTSSFSNEQGEIERAPFLKDFPLEIFNRFEFSEENGKTTISLSGYPVNATDEEKQAFSGMKANMQQGFAGTFNQLQNYISKKMTT